jgi:3-mercaptopyruvate sulfurtransferase SseA
MVENRKKTFPWFVIGGGLLLLLAAVMYAVLKKPATAMVTATPGSVSQVERVTLEEAKAAYDNGSAVFLDVRDASSYNASHIPGAILMPVSELPSRNGELNPKAWIIPYCT